MVEHLLAKERVESSNLFIRFLFCFPARLLSIFESKALLSGLDSWSVASSVFSSQFFPIFY